MRSAGEPLADYIQTHHDDVLKVWRRSVRADTRISSADGMDVEALHDHLPQILGELCHFLRHSEKSDPPDLRRHGIQRWLHDYSLTDLILEIERFRTVLLIDFMTEYLVARPEISISTLHEIQRSVYEFFQELIVCSVIEFTDENEKKLRANEAKIRQLSLTDPLTGLANRRHLETRLSDEIERSNRYGEPLTLVLLDLDSFKAVNDKYGHNLGDRVLEDVTSCLCELSRAADFVARHGGEEFIVLLPDTSLDKAKPLVERILAAMSKRLIDPLTSPVTASFGLAQWHDHETDASLIARADAAMYRAKKAGGNRFETEAGCDVEESA